MTPATPTFPVSRSRDVTVTLAVLLAVSILTFLLTSELTPRKSRTSSPIPNVARDTSTQVIRSHLSTQVPSTPQPASFLKRFLSVFPSFISALRSHPPRQSDPPLPHAFRTDTVAGVPIAYHNPFPPNRLSAVTLLFHACHQSASDWFTQPEHRRLSAELLRRRHALLAISSANRHTGCWSTRHPAMDNHDAARVRLVLRQWLSTQGVSHLAPLHAVGLSSGATFLTVLAATTPPILPRFYSQALYLSAGNQRALRTATPNFPSSLFVRLQHDNHYATTTDVATARAILLSRGVPVVAELPLTRERWHQLSISRHEPRIPFHVSAEIFRYIPTCQGKIECAVIKAANASVNAVWQKPELRQALLQVERVLNGKHEMSGTHANMVAEWLVKHGNHEGRRWR